MTTCYKHPERPAGVVCQRCDRHICPSCMHQASVGFHCPECTKTGKQQVYQGVGSLRTRPILTQVLIATNVLVFIASVAMGSSLTGGGRLSDFQIDTGLYAPFVDQGEWWRLVTSGFMHDGIIHLGLNMWILWMLGQAVEQLGGRLRFGIVYGLAMLGGSLGALVLDPGAFTVGASGAIFGLAGAIFLAQRAQGVAFRDSPLLGFLILNAVISFSIPGISIGGHAGGFLAGGLAGWILFDLARRPGLDKRLPFALCAGLALGLLMLSEVVASNYTPGL